AVTEHDRFDRTLGIPDRAVPMWPVTTLSFHDPDASTTARAEAICDAICAWALPTWRWPAPATAAALLGEVAPALYGRHPTGRAHRRGAGPDAGRGAGPDRAIVLRGPRRPRGLGRDRPRSGAFARRGAGRG